MREAGSKSSTPIAFLILLFGVFSCYCQTQSSDVSDPGVNANQEGCDLHCGPHATCKRQSGRESRCFCDILYVSTAKDPEKGLHCRLDFGIVTLIVASTVILTGCFAVLLLFLLRKRRKEQSKPEDQPIPNVSETPKKSVDESIYYEVS
ncbi:unnamed protein product [Calicophoron daubneyi]|uniref:Uncharacterized protein n=1 Tax=Calicophoron daubneyi TaxID=300641 RepID=A0AAV2T3K1_CALDB